MPLPAIVSIMHRASGAALFLALPLVLWCLQLSLTSGRTFAELQTMFSNPLVKLVMVGLLWGYLHHLCAGIRHVVMDMHYGLELKTVRLTSALVVGISITLTVIIGAQLW
jgi:succinate dehydrogenase / fumarate reductase cytochrome b subunit